MDGLSKLPVALLKMVHSKVVNRKAEQALRELANGKKQWEDVCDDSGELFRFTLLIDALDKASTYRKANLLKDLYLACDDEEKTDRSDDWFFELFSIIGSLSDREIELLYLLERFITEDIKNKKMEDKYAEYFQKVEEDKMDGGVLSDAFYHFAEMKLGISPDHVYTLMRRLESTGLVEKSVIDHNALYQEYRHTILYRDIKSRLIIAMENAYGASSRLTSDHI